MNVALHHQSQSLYDAAAIEAALGVLLEPGQVTELRVLDAALTAEMPVRMELATLTIRAVSSENLKASMRQQGCTSP